MDNTLAYKGGKPVRTKEFRSKPYVTPEMRAALAAVIEDGRFSKFIGSPISGTKENLRKKSQDVATLTDLVSFLGGPSVRKLEALWCQKHECDYAISVNSATSGLTTAVMAADIGPGDEVICSPFSFTASSAAIVSANAIPVFADLDLETFCLSPQTAEAAVTKSTKAIMAIHWNGNAGDLDGIMAVAKAKGLKVIEDASQAPGNKYQNKFLGTFGDVGVFSLNEPKNIMTGEGGLVVTNNEKIAVKSRLIRNHGEAIVDDSFDDESLSNIIGYNFRLVEVLAELGVHQVEKLEQINGIRRENYLYLMDRLQSVCGEFLVPQKITHRETYSPYHVGFRWLSEKSGIHRNLIIAVLRKEGVPISQGISRLMSDHPLFKRQIAYGQGHCPFSCHLYAGRDSYKIPELPNATRLHRHEYIGLAQVGWPNTKEDMDDIVRAFEKIMANKNALQKEDFKITDEFISWR